LLDVDIVCHAKLGWASHTFSS